MKIAFLTPSSGPGFYCENCIRDLDIVIALRKAGHEALMVPLYLPPTMDNPQDDLPRTEVFLGGVNVYLQQKSAVFRKTPRWVDRLFDSPVLLRLAARMAGMTSARDLGATMLSVLQGDQGRQAKEVQRLLEHLAAERPDVVCLSNALLAGLAPAMAGQVGAPIACWLQDEDGFLDAIAEPVRTEAWDAIRRRTGAIDAFLAPSRYYADVMTERLGLPAAKVHVVYPGIDPAVHPPAERPAAPAVGFISRMSRDKGLDTLVEAMLTLRADSRLARLRLLVAGGSTPADAPFLAELRRKLAGGADDVEYLSAFDRNGRLALLRNSTVLSVPTRQGEAFGLYVLEAFACGVPVVLPRHGAFPELIDATGGGLLCEPNDPASLAEALRGILLDAPAARRLGAAGRRGAAAQFGLDRTRDNFLAICKKITESRRPGGA